MNQTEKIGIIIAITGSGIFGVLAYSWIISETNKLFPEPKETYEECFNFWNKSDNSETIKLGFNQTVEQYCEDLK